jgi:hypothetical protein
MTSVNLSLSLRHRREVEGGSQPEPIRFVSFSYMMARFKILAKSRFRAIFRDFGSGVAGIIF